MIKKSGLEKRGDFPLFLFSAPSSRPLLGVPLLLLLLLRHLGPIGMFLGIEDVNGKLQKQGPLQEDGEAGIQGGWKGDQDAGALGVALILLPVVSALVALFGAGPFLQREAGDEEEEDGEEDGAEDGGVKGRGGMAAYVVRCRGGGGDCEYSCRLKRWIRIAAVGGIGRGGVLMGFWGGGGKERSMSIPN